MSTNPIALILSIALLALAIATHHFRVARALMANEPQISVALMDTEAR